jgi:hypothetical protein
VSACPTGSLIEINAYDLFRERSPAMAQLARHGFDADLTKRDRKEVLPVMPFTEGLYVRSGGVAKVKRGRYAPMFMWLVGLLAFVLCTGEILLRLYAPEKSFLYSMLRSSKAFADLPESAVLEQITYRPGPGLSVWCGVIGTGLMIIAALYPLFRRIKAFRWLASNTMWFDFHLMAGTIGPMFVALHSWFRLDFKGINFGSATAITGFWSMVIVTISGFLGRYLYTQVPEMSSGVELEELDHQRTFEKWRPMMPVAIAELDREMGLHRSRAQRIAGSPSVLYAILWLLWESFIHNRVVDFETFARRRRLKLLGVTDRRLRKDLARRTNRMIVITRRQVVAPKAQLLLNSWKKVHVPFTIALTAFAAIHIWDAWARAW